MGVRCMQTRRRPHRVGLFFGAYVTIDSPNSGSTLSSQGIGYLKADNIAVFLLASGGYTQSSSTVIGQPGYDNGMKGAQATVAAANALNITGDHKITLFADIEAQTAVSSDFIRGWADGAVAGGFRAGFYGSESNPFANAFCAAATNANVSASAVFSSGPQANTGGLPSPGRTTEAASPPFKPDLTKCSAGTTSVWQYGIPSDDNSHGNVTPPAIVPVNADTDEAAPASTSVFYVP